MGETGIVGIQSEAIVAWSVHWWEGLAASGGRRWTATAIERERGGNGREIVKAEVDGQRAARE